MMSWNMPSSRAKIAVSSSLSVMIALISVIGDEPGPSKPFPTVTNSEKSVYGALNPRESIRQLALPSGFEATVFASEPDVQQPIAIQFDAEGRLWVAEGYTYAEQALNYDLKLRDRIVIFEDADQDGRFDSRKVFWEGAQRLTGLEIGFDGVYALTLPEMIFLPDRNRDDVPDSAPIVLLDGFDHARARHTMANGLAWGPDGWLYGRQGILGTSLVGKPGSPETERVSANVGIWRFHPKTHRFEIVTSGTTNPWGMDWNELGEAFHINTVIGHLWHVIPGAHFRRMFGEDPRPNIYQPIEQHADHVHWDTKELWSDIRTLGVTPTTSQAGGGHAHTGLMIYLGDNWPEEYRGDVFTINFHGRRLNRDKLVAEGSGFVAQHRPDFARFGDPWFRGIDLKYGPDGGVYVADWSDTGECHDHDGVHRVSGRIYKITYGKPKRPEVTDVRTQDLDGLVRLLGHRNEWFARQARLEIQRRSYDTDWNDHLARKSLEPLVADDSNPVRQVRGLFALHAASLDTQDMLLDMLRNPNLHLQVWATRFLTDKSRFPVISEKTIAQFAILAERTESPVVRLALASAIRDLPVASRNSVARPLIQRSADAKDHNLPMMIWFGIEPLASSAPVELAALFESSRIPLLSRWIARRLAQDYEADESAIARILGQASNQPLDNRTELMRGFAEALRGRRNARKPAKWDAFASTIDAKSGHQSAELMRTLGAFFGDGIALETIRSIAMDSKQEIGTRRRALKSLIEARSPQLREICLALFTVRDMSPIAAEGLATFDDPKLADEIIGNFGRVYANDKPAVFAALTSRENWCFKLLDAVEAGKIRRDEISAIIARQIRSHRNQALDEKLGRVWGSLRDSSAEKIKSIETWKNRLTPNTLATADAAQGKTVFAKSCSSCHKMYDEGGTSGPDLTGSGRDNLDYLLANILDPSAQVPANYRVSDLSLKDGRLLSGVIVSRTEKTITVQTPAEQVIIDANDVEEVRGSELSLMPEGLLRNLSEQEVRDLFGFLMRK